MPQRGRSRRVAARQSQLKQRKKRPVKGPSGVPVTTAAPGEGELEAEGAVQGESPSVSPVAQPVAPRRPAPFRQSETRATVYQYVKPEIRRIAILASGILVILVALSFVLR